MVARPGSAEVASSTPDVDAQVRAAWASLLDDCDAIADDITLTLLDRDAALYDSISPALRAEVRSNTREHVRRGVEVFAGRDDVSFSVPDLWRETGRRRARQGFPMEQVLSAYTLGSRVLWRAMVTRGEAMGVDRAALLEAGLEVWSALDVQNAVMVEAYRRESQRQQRRDLHLQQGVLEALLGGRGAEPAVVTEAAEVLGLSATAEVACVVALPGAEPEEPLAAMDDRAAPWAVTAWWYPRGDRWFGLVGGALGTDADIARALDPYARTRIGVALAGDGLQGFPTAFQLAARSAETLAEGEVGAVAVTDRLAEVLLVSAGPVGTLLVRETLGPLLALRPSLRDTLLRTLAALLHHSGSPTHAAAELYCHRNTVMYRMRQIEQLTGRDLSSPRDAQLFALAMLAERR